MARLCKSGLIGALVAALVGAALHPASIWASHREPCASRGAATVIETEQARVFQKRTGTGRSRVFALFGCDKKTRKKWRLGVYEPYTPGFIPLGAVSLAGHYVAFVHSVCFFVNDCGSAIVVRDLKSGAVKFDSRSEERRTTIASFVINQNGSLAWIADGAVQKNDLAGYQVVDSINVNTFDPFSLALSADGRTFYWKRAFNDLRCAALN